MRVSEAFVHYIVEKRLNGGSEKTAKNYRSVLNGLLKVVGDVPVELITYEHITRWKMHLMSEGKANSTIASNLSSLREVLKYLKKHHHNVLDPRDIELPRVIVKEPDYLDYSEVQNIIDAAERPRDKALIATLWSTGARISEVLSLDRDSIQDNKAVVLGKGSKYITLYIDKHAQQYIQDYLETRNDRIPAIFTSAQRRRLTVQRAEQIVNELTADAGIDKRVTPHTFRHSFASDLLHNGADIRSVQMLLHHSSITTTQRYTHIKDKLKEDNYARYHSK